LAISFQIAFKAPARDSTFDGASHSRSFDASSLEMKIGYHPTKRRPLPRSSNSLEDDVDADGEAEGDESMTV
jgi:hypothetical protein